MKRRFIYLVVVTLVALLALWIFTMGDKSPEKSAANTLLLPEISEQINIVDSVDIISAGNRVVATMLKGEEGWRLQQMGGYRADWSDLQTLLANLAQARVVETKTDKPEYYDRLGVEDITAADASGVLVKLGIGSQTTGIVVGQQAQARQGHYVRLQSSAVSALVDRRLDVSTETSDWVDASIIDINSAEVAEVEIIHPSGERLLVMRISADQTDFDLAGMPPGREIKSSWAVNSLGSVLSMLELEAVHAEGGFDWSDPVRMRLLLFSGVEIMAEMLESGEQYLLRLSASHPAANVTAENKDDIDSQASMDVAKVVEDINQKTSGWIYAIAKSKYDALVKKPEDLLKPQEPA